MWVWVVGTALCCCEGTSVGTVGGGVLVGTNMFGVCGRNSELLRTWPAGGCCVLAGRGVTDVADVMNAVDAVIDCC